MTEPAATADDRGDDPQTTVAEIPSEDSPRVLHLTNRFNLLVSLGARLIQPREGYTKYYDDLLDIVPGRVPLLDHTPGIELLERVATAAGAFPALIELDSTEGLPARRVDGGWVVDGAIAWSRVVAIHFRDERAAREHRSRPYGNIAAHDDQVRISPELFAGADSERDSAYIAALQSDEATASPADLLATDRRRGAIGAAVQAASDAETMAVAAAALDRSLKSPVAWFQLEAPGNATQRTGVEAAAFDASMEVLTATDVQADWRPRHVLSLVRENALARVTARKAAEQLESNIARVDAVLAGDVEFAPFRKNTTGLAPVKALLLVLLREDLTSLLSWSSEETGADPLVRQVAATYAGALRGIAREATKSRSTVVDDLTARRFTESGATSSPVRIESDSDTDALIVGETVVATVSRPSPKASELFDALTDAKRSEAAMLISRKLGWSDLITTEVTFGAAATVEVIDGRLVVRGVSAQVVDQIDPSTVAERLVSGKVEGAAIQGLLPADS